MDQSGKRDEAVTRAIFCTTVSERVYITASGREIGLGTRGL
jgi:hypothetical protein